MRLKQNNATFHFPTILGDARFQDEALAQRATISRGAAVMVIDRPHQPQVARLKNSSSSHGFDRMPDPFQLVDAGPPYEMTPIICGIAWDAYNLEEANHRGPWRPISEIRGAYLTDQQFFHRWGGIMGVNRWDLAEYAQLQQTIQKRSSSLLNDPDAQKTHVDLADYPLLCFGVLKYFRTLNLETGNDSVRNIVFYPVSLEPGTDDTGAIIYDHEHCLAHIERGLKRLWGENPFNFFVITDPQINPIPPEPGIDLARVAALYRRKD